jgi:serine protease DegS
MTNSTQRGNLAFVAGSVLAGLVVAWLVNRMLPPPTAPAAPQSAGTANEIALPNGSPAASPMQVAMPGGETLQAGNPPAGLNPASAPTGMDALLSPVTSYAAAVRASAPAVVSVYTLTTVQEGVQRQANGRLVRIPGGVYESLGSGVIVDPRGYIVTNDHVIRNADKIKVQLADGRVADATQQGRDPETDLAVLKIDLQPLPVMTLGRSDRIEVGDVVLAIGNPLGLSQTVTHGIISFTGRGGFKLATYENFIQTDAAINHGNSGGALVNARGELIGINTAVLGQDQGAEGLGLAIPVDLVRGVMKDILEHGQVMRGWIGLAFRDITAEDARQVGLPYTGVVIVDMDPRSPALPALLARGDKIETIDGREVRNAKDTQARIANHKPGTPVKITGMRGAQPFSVSVTVIIPPPITK